MHTTVLLHETVDAVVTNTSGIYIDATFGAGGHTALLLEKLAPDARVLAFDKDASALANHALQDPRLTLVHASFTDIAQHMAQHNMAGLDGMVADFGVSSMQLDTAERGFSFRQDAPLDMRMDQQTGMTAAEWLNSANEQEIAHVLYTYGEERKSRAIAKSIVRTRVQHPLSRTAELADLIAKIVGKGKHTRVHPATRSFQAIRIHINNELAEIETLLHAAWQLLVPGGILACISFHSLEDRLIKHTFAKWVKQDVPAYIPIVTQATSEARKMTRVKPTHAEVLRNPRARSALLRVIEKRD